MTKRKPRPPGKMPATFAQAGAEEILAAMSNWPELMAHKLSAAGPLEAAHERAVEKHQIRHGTGGEQGST